MDKKKLNAKDFINIGIFTVIYFVMFFITGMMGYIPIFAVIIPLGLGILGGIPFMLFLTKTGKFGAATIMGTLVSVLCFLMGQSWISIPFGIVFGFLADLIFNAGKYKNWKYTVLGYCVFTEWVIGSMLPMWIMRDTFFAAYRNNGGTDVKEYSYDSLMRNFSFVFQNVYLFQDTIANNIRFGQEDAPMERVVEAAKKACCHDFIMALPDGYDTVIGEGGASLSGGEKQRISIARAIMKDAPVIILDEATANVDPENEQELMAAIDALTREKTIFMIAHRLKTVRNADRILVVDSGRIVQQGKHEELMREEGIYKRFVQSRELAAGWKL
ncbi:MAG: MptD family putative ECF transporter S component [Lachnospiraceae bacterium]